MYYIFDGTYYGWLCCVFEAFERKEYQITPITSAWYVGEIFDLERQIHSDANKAKRIIIGLEKIIGKERTKDFYRAFLYENKHVWKAAFDICVEIFRGNVHILDNFGNDAVIKFTEALRKVSRERHRMKAFVRFQTGIDGLYVAVIEPDFNVLPLIINFFRNRYTDQEWIIFDVKRKYGVHWNKKEITEVELNTVQKNELMAVDSLVSLDEKEEYYKNLWLQYFKSTNIEARRNMKLHLRHVPKRYWKYLPEKNLDIRL